MTETARAQVSNCSMETVRSGTRAGTQTSERGFGINQRHFPRQGQDPASERDRRRAIPAGRNCLEETRARTNESNHAGVSFAGHITEQINPLIKDFGERAHDVAARD